MSKKEVIKDSEIIEDEVGDAKKIKKYIENGKTRKIKKNLTKKEMMKVLKMIEHYLQKDF